MDDLTKLKELQLDALREVANIGAGHAATALSQMTGQTIMINVPQCTVAAIEDVPNQISTHEEPIAAVLVKMMGDLTGTTLLVLPTPTAMRLADLMAGRPAGTATSLGAFERSAVQEAGNILSGAYLNALAEFMGMVLLNTPPQLVVDLSDAVLSSAFLEASQAGDQVLCVESQFHMKELGETMRGFFLLLPDLPSLQAILRAIKVA